LLLAGWWTDDQPDAFATGGFLPHKFLSGMQGSLDLLDSVADAPAARPLPGPQGLEGTDSEPGDQVARKTSGVCAQDRYSLSASPCLAV
jgi:hypothetical protein